MSHSATINPGQWTPSGFEYIAGASLTSGNSDILAFPGDGSAPRELLATRYDEHSPAISPDGRWMAYSSDESGVRQVYVKPLQGAGGRTLVSEREGQEPVWSRHGSRLYYVVPQGTTSRLMSVRLGDGVPPRVLERTEVFEQLVYEPVGNHANWDVMPDGRLVFIEPVTGTQIVVVSDWSPEREAQR